MSGTYLYGQQESKNCCHNEQRCRNENRAGSVDEELQNCERREFIEFAYTLGPTLAAVPSLFVVTILMTGAKMPVIRLNEEARASPVPRCGVGNASGV